MTSLLLHIGHPKTGSTALQMALSSNAGILRRQSVLYPTQAEPRSEKHVLAMPFLTGEENEAMRRRTGLSGQALHDLSRQYWRALVSEWQASRPDLLILSGEGFWRVPREKQQAFRRGLAEVCDQVTVCAYLRSPAARFLSQMNQSVRMFRAIPPPEPDYYKSVIQAYQAGGFESLSWNVFSRSRLLDGDIVADFCSRFLPPSLTAQDLPRATSANESISGEALAILGQARLEYAADSAGARDPRRVRAVNLIREADQATGGERRPRLKPEIEKALVADSKDLQWLRDECGINFDDVDYSLLTATDTADLAGLSRVEDFCLIDQDRLEALQASTSREISAIYRGSGLKKFFFRR